MWPTLVSVTECVRHAASAGGHGGVSAEGLSPLVGGGRSRGHGRGPGGGAQAQGLVGGQGHAPWRVGCCGSTQLWSQYQIPCELCQVTWAPASVSHLENGGQRVSTSQCCGEAGLAAKHSGCHGHTAPSHHGSRKGTMGAQEELRRTLPALTKGLDLSLETEEPQDEAGSSSKSVCSGVIKGLTQAGGQQEARVRGPPAGARAR